MSYLYPYCSSFPLEDCVWWVSGVKGRNNWWRAIFGEKYDWQQPNRLWVVQTGESVNQAKVFKAHAVSQGFCGNLINALKLLANRQEDGDGLLQNIAANLGEGSRKCVTNVLRYFIQVDKHRVLQVGHLNEASENLKYEGRKDQKVTQR